MTSIKLVTITRKYVDASRQDKFQKEIWFEFFLMKVSNETIDFHNSVILRLQMFGNVKEPLCLKLNSLNQATTNTLR